MTRAGWLSVGLAIASGPLLAPAAESWAVSAAPVHFVVRVVRAPSDPSAGILALLPDGGILPKDAEPVVVSAAGETLKSACVWRNPQEGLGVVFEPQPEGSRLAIYVQRATAPLPPATALGFTPSLLLYTRTGVASLEEARQLAKGSPPGTHAVMGPVEIIGHRENPFGADDNYVSYYVGWLKPAVKGRTWICTVSDEGSECLIDGKTAASWPGLHTRQAGQKGEFGDWIELTGPLHKVEYFHFEKTGDQEANLCWRPADQGKDKLPQTIPAEAYIRSGRADLVEVEARDGRPLAIFTAEPHSYLWLRDKPLYVFALAAQFTARHPTNTAYNWTLENKLSLAGRNAYWLTEGPLPQEVTLAVQSAGMVSKATRMLVTPTTPPRANPNHPGYRQVYREALLNRCRAVAPPKRPCADWTPDFWAALAEVVEPGKNPELLLDVFQRSRSDVLSLDEQTRWTLEDHFFETVRLADRTAAGEWLDRLEREERNGGRRFDWKLTRIEFLLYDRNDTQTAARLAQQLQAEAVRPEDAVRATVRLGDVDRLSGRYEEARRKYAAAQDRYQELFQGARRGVAQQTAVGPRRPKDSDTGADAISASLLAEGWRVAAVREASFRVTVRSYLRQTRPFEARRVLRQWELELPLTKLTGDFPLAEAEYYVAIGDAERAARILRAYREGVEISSALPEAMTLELDCLRQLKRTEELKNLARDILRRFPVHPVAKRAREVLGQ